MDGRGIIFFEGTVARRDHPRERYEVVVLDRIDGLELRIGPPGMRDDRMQLVLMLTGDEARDLADGLERAANRVYPER